MQKRYERAIRRQAQAFGFDDAWTGEILKLRDEVKLSDWLDSEYRKYERALVRWENAQRTSIEDLAARSRKGRFLTVQGRPSANAVQE